MLSSLDRLKLRLDYAGGTQEGRMQKDKLKTLKKALLYSYQAATAILKDGREFKCLINRDQLTNDYDNKILSIPYENICLSSLVEEKTNIQVGDVIEWKETSTHWIIYSQYLEEDAYFRGDMRRCKEIEVAGQKQYAYVKGPSEQDLSWKKVNNIYFNELNYTLQLYISKTDTNLKKFKRFEVIKIDGNPYEVQAVDNVSLDGIIEVYLKEYFNNSVAEAASIEAEKVSSTSPYIVGPALVYPYDIVEYKAQDIKGDWFISDESLARFVSTTEDLAVVEIITGKSGKFTLYCGELGFPISIESL